MRCNGAGFSQHRILDLDVCSFAHSVDAITERKKGRESELILHKFFYFSHSLARLCRAAAEFFSDCTPAATWALTLMEALGRELRGKQGLG